MLKPRTDGALPISLAELPEALGLLTRLGQFIDTGTYGALTPDRSGYGASGMIWPLACTPVPHAVLKSKFAATFGVGNTAEDDHE